MDLSAERKELVGTQPMPFRSKLNEITVADPRFKTIGKAILNYWWSMYLSFQADKIMKFESKTPWNFKNQGCLKSPEGVSVFSKSMKIALFFAKAA